MLQVIDNKIYFDKGDDGVLPVGVSFDESVNGKYAMGENEILVLSVRATPDTGLPLLLRAMSNPGSDRIIFTKAMTSELDPGMYSADIQFVDKNGMSVKIWPDNALPYVKPDKTKNWKNFILTPEVTE